MAASLAAPQPRRLPAIEATFQTWSEALKACWNYLGKDVLSASEINNWFCERKITVKSMASVQFYFLLILFHFWISKTLRAYIKISSLGGLQIKVILLLQCAGARTSFPEPVSMHKFDPGLNDLNDNLKAFFRSLSGAMKTLHAEGITAKKTFYEQKKWRYLVGMPVSLCSPCCIVNCLLLNR